MIELETLVEWLKGARNLSAISRASGIAVSTLSDIKNGKHTPRLVTYLRLEKVRADGPPPGPPLW